MNEIRSFASLSGSLLARKGGAKPAMRPRPLSTESMLDDLGWDDFGDVGPRPGEHVPSSIAGLTPAPKPTPVPEEVPVHVQQRALSERFGEAESAAPTSLPQAAVTALRAPAEEPVAEEPSAEEPQPVQQVQQVQPQPEPREENVRQPQPQPQPRAPRQRQQQQQERSAGRKAAFTLRLDADRHLRLRLAVAVTSTSAQALVTRALDEYLANLPEIGSLAKQLPARAGTRS